MLRVEGECGADVEVPVVPMVLAGMFGVGVGDFELGEFLVEGAVVVEKKVFGAAVEAEGGELLLGAGLGEVEKVVVRAGGVGSEDSLELPVVEAVVGLVPAHGAGHDCAGMGMGGDEGIRVGQCGAKGTVTAHGEAADGATFACFACGKGSVDQRGDFFAQVGSVARPLVVIRVETAVTVGHDDDQRMADEIHFQPRSTLPDGVVVRQTVKKIKDGISALWGLFIIRHQGKQLGLLTQNSGEEVEGQKHGTIRLG